MAKARKRPQVAPQPSINNTASSDQVKELQQQMAKMQGEIDGLKKQVAQLVAFIKQKLK